MFANQAICDGNLDSGFPGSIHDSRMLDHSWIPEVAHFGKILNFPVTTIENDIRVKPYLTGDPAYSLTPYCMKPYSYHTKVKENKYFNYQLSRARSVIESAFGVLKVKWRILNSCMEVSPMQASKIFIVCCILHNILQIRGEDYEDVIEAEEPDNNIPFIVTRDIYDESLRSALAKHVQKELRKESI